MRSCSFSIRKNESVEASREAICARGRPRFSRPQASSSRTSRLKSCASGSWSTRPTRSLMRASESSCVRRPWIRTRSEEHTSELQSPCNLVCRLLLEKKKKKKEKPNKSQTHQSDNETH